MTTAEPPIPSPTDTAASTADLTCPLCGYSLRGLTEPRCPECGFTFQWAELLDVQRTRHPWLFEHGRGRNVRTFLATYLRAMLPWRFWRQVTPANPVHVGRLVLYWLIACLPLAIVALPVGPIFAIARQNLAERAFYRHAMGRSLPTTVVDAQLDANYPAPWSPTFAVEAWDLVVHDRFSRGFVSRQDGTTPAVIAAAAVAAGWPWLSFACLSVFQVSMLRAKTAPAHVLRAAVYGCDCGLLMPVAVAGYYALRQWPAAADGIDFQFRSPIFPADAPLAVWVVAACAVAAAVRLAFAYDRYLRFHWPAATVLTSQAMALLVAFLVLFGLMTKL